MQNKCVQLELSCEDVMSAMEENDYKLITLLLIFLSSLPFTILALHFAIAYHLK